MGKQMNLTFESSLTDITEVNSSFDKGILSICYPGLNRNRSFIAKDDLERCLPTLTYVPVVGNYIRDEEDFGGHDVEVITTLDGGLRMVNITQPVGVVPADGNVYFDTIVDENGEEKEYLFAEVLLWKRQEAYKKIKEEGVISHSMELNVKSGETIDGVFHIYDFEFTALCLLGKDVIPCFEDSALEVFAISDFKQQFELMMSDFKQSFNLATTSNEDNHYSRNDNLTKGGEEDLKDKKEEIFVEDETVEVEPTEEFSEEEAPAEAPETEETFEEGADAPAESEDAPAEADDAPAEPEVEEEPAEEEPEAEPEEDADFALTREVEDSLWEVLRNTDRYNEDGYDWTRYFFVDFDMEAGMVYFEDSLEGWKLFGCAYAMDGDNVIIDFDTKRRFKYTIVEFDEGSQAGNPLNLFAAMRDDAKACYDAKFAAIEAELEELRAYKANAEESVALSERQEVISEFTDLEGIEEFTTLCEHVLEYELDALREKCFAIRGKNMNPASATFSHSSGMPRFVVESNGIHPEVDEDAPYGGVVEKYKQHTN